MARLGKRFAPGLGVVAMVLALAACGSSSSSSSSSSSASGASGGTSTPASSDSSVVSAAQAAITKATSPVTAFNGPTSSPPAAKGKNVYIINCSPDTEGCRRLSDANLAAAKAIGWTGSKVLATDGSVTQFNSAMRQAIQAGASGIIIDAFPSAAVSGPLATAASKGIPVIAEVSGDTTPNTGANFKGGLYTVVDGNNSHLGALAADWAIAQTKGKANVGSFEVASFPVLQQRYAGFQKAMSACTTCKVNSPVTVPLTSLTTQAAPAVAEFLRSHADVNYFFSTFDGGAILAAQGIRSAGSKVPMVSLEGNAPNLEMIRSGGPEVAVVALPLEWIGWAAIDEMNRAFNKQAPAPQWTPNGSGIPLKVVTKSNAPAKGQSYQGDIDFESAFKKLWQG